MPASCPDRHPAATTTAPAAGARRRRSVTPATRPVADARPRSTSSSITVDPGRPAGGDAARRPGGGCRPGGPRRGRRRPGCRGRAAARAPGTRAADEPAGGEPELVLVGEQVVGGRPVGGVDGHQQGAVGHGSRPTARTPPRARAANAGQARAAAMLRAVSALLAEVGLADRGQHAGRRPGGAAAGLGVDHGDGHARPRPPRQATDSPITPPPDHHDVAAGVRVGHAAHATGGSTRRTAAPTAGGQAESPTGACTICRTTHGPTSSRAGRSTSLVGATR